MDNLRLKEISYSASQGIAPALDSFEIREIIEAAAKTEVLQDNVYDDLKSILQSIPETAPERIKNALNDIEKGLKTLFATIEANDDLPECFVSAFTENLDYLQDAHKIIKDEFEDIESNFDDIQEAAETAQGRIYDNEF